MDDDYVLKYVPVMTNKGKTATFGDPNFDNFLQEESKEILSFKKLLNDKDFNEETDKILSQYLSHPNYVDFKKRLVFYISQKKSDLQWRASIYNPPDRKKIKRSLSGIDNAVSKIDFSDAFRQQYIQEISKQLKKQSPKICPFDCFDTAQEIARFSENILPLIQHSAREAISNINDKNRPKKFVEQEAHIKYKMAKVLSEMIFKFFNFKPKNTTYIETPEILDALFILCCKTIGLENVSVQSNHVQDAIKTINLRVRENKASSAT